MSGYVVKIVDPRKGERLRELLALVGKVETDSRDLLGPKETDWRPEHQRGPVKRASDALMSAAKRKFRCNVITSHSCSRCLCCLY